MAEIAVAPFAGAWIETFDVLAAEVNLFVAPFAGAWIETYRVFVDDHQIMSLPSRERGLKPTESLLEQEGSVAPFEGAWIETPVKASFLTMNTVAPFAGAWIETSFLLMNQKQIKRRSLRGSVD